MNEKEKSHEERKSFPQKKLIARVQPEELPNGKQPYPFFIFEDGTIDRQDFWKGKPNELLGFSDKPHTQEVNFFFDEFKKCIEFAIGKYPVLKDSNNDIWTLLSKVESVDI